MTTSRFNRLLRMLDEDPLLDDVDYFSTLELEAGDDSGAALTALKAKIDADDTSASYSAIVTTNFTTIGTSFNTLVSELNISTGVYFSNYPSIPTTYTIDYEAIVVALDSSNSKIEVEYNVPFLKGDTTHYKGYTTEIEVNPMHFGDPGVLKHISDASLVFDDNNFYSGFAGFKSDVSGSLEDIYFRGKGPGTWGHFLWSKGIWDGEGNDDPFRVLVPRNKAKCRYLIIKFTHKNARESFKFLGTSFKMRPFAERAYKD